MRTGIKFDVSPPDRLRLERAIKDRSGVRPPKLAIGPASALDDPLRADILLVAQRRRGLLCQAGPQRRLALRRRSSGRQQPLHQ